MSRKTAQAAYDELRRFFGLRGRDDYLNAAEGDKAVQLPNEPPSTKNKVIASIFNDLFGDETSNSDAEEIYKKMSGIGRETLEEIFCVTPYGEKDAGNDKIPLNQLKTKAKGFEEQGRLASEELQLPNGTFTVSSISKKFSEAAPGGEGRIDAIQVFPVRYSTEVADTDILTLFLSTINSLNMSLAVPYVDVLIATPLSVNASGENANTVYNSPFSLGRFFGALSTDADANSSYTVGPSATTLSTTEGTRLGAVASMEVFTTPQTLVNATQGNIQYNENVSSGRHIDVFRPFMAIESLAIHVVSSGAGIISNKHADMKIRLFDRGRLRDISAIVAPSRFRAVQFDIEYGWSHPSGGTKTRLSDANIQDRIGQLIDSMRVKESYMVVNSNFSFEQDGSVSINLKLSMLGGARLASEEVTLGSSDTSLTEIQKYLDEVKKYVTDTSGSEINTPQILTGDASTFVSVDEENLKELRNFLKYSGHKGTRGKVAASIAKLIGSNKKKVGGTLDTFRSQRADFVKKFIEEIKSTPDPFLRKDGLSNGAVVTLSDINRGDYVSLGKLIMAALGDHMQKYGDVIFVFGCFNESAAAMFDHNIAQFPIRIEPRGKKNNETEVTLRTVLNDAFKKNAIMTPQTFLQIINQAFILRQSSSAYGLDNIFVPDRSDKDNPEKDVYAKDVTKMDPDTSAGKLYIEDKKVQRLRQIYSDTRIRPSFTVPMLNFKIDTKPSSDGKKNVVRVIINDTAASQTGDLQQIFNDVTSQGFFIKNKIVNPSSKGKVRHAQHGEVAEKIYKVLEETKVFEPYSGKDLFEDLQNYVQDNGGGEIEPDDTKRKLIIGELKNIMFAKKFDSADSSLRNAFYEVFPTIIYGSMGSGIINAQLSSNQNDALTTINIVAQFKQGEVPRETGVPMLIHPTQLSLDVFGSPLFKYAQTFFIDFGTGTSADNFYAVTGVDMNFAPGEFKCSLKMTQRDVFGRFMKIRDSAYNVLVSMLLKDREEKKKPGK